jgi:hypothetical protein
MNGYRHRMAEKPSFKQRSKELGVIIILLVVVVGGLLATPWLPRTCKVRIDGVEIKRSTLTAAKVKDSNESVYQDIRYIQTSEVETGAPFVLRNEDAHFWPPYFKFDSADLSAQAANFARNRPEDTILVTYYGFRVAMLDEFPNAVNLEAVDRDYQHFPLFNLLYALLVLTALLTLIWKIRKFRRSIGNKASPAPAVAAAGSS